MIALIYACRWLKMWKFNTVSFHDLRDSLSACRTIFASPICNLPALDVIEKCFGSSPEFKKWSPKLKDTVETLEHQRTVWRVRSASITRVAAALPKSRRSTAWFARRFQIGVCVCVRVWLDIAEGSTGSQGIVATAFESGHPNLSFTLFLMRWNLCRTCHPVFLVYVWIYE